MKNKEKEIEKLCAQCTVCPDRDVCTDMIETVGSNNFKKMLKLENRVLDKVRKKGLSDEWIDYVFDLIFIHFILINPKKPLTFKCKECLDFKSDYCEGGNFPDCFIERVKVAKKQGFKPSDLVNYPFLMDAGRI